jgi:hypothetical protein
MPFLSHLPRPLAFALPALGAATVLVSIAVGFDGGLSGLGLGWFGWLMSPYVALAVVLLLARRSPSRGFWISVVIGAAAVLGQTVLLTWISLTSQEDLAAVGILGSPAACLPVVAIATGAGLIFRRLERTEARDRSEGSAVSQEDVSVS